MGGDVGKVGKDALGANEKASDAVGYTNIAAAIVAGVFAETALGFAVDFIGPAAMLAHFALAQEEASAAQQRHAYADFVRN